MDVDTLTGSVVFAEWFFHGLTGLGLIRLRKRPAGAPAAVPELRLPARARALTSSRRACVLAGNWR
jgi:hypothetical protein